MVLKVKLQYDWLDQVEADYLNQKFQDELRCLFGMSKTTKSPKECNPIVPEAFSANRGFFEPRTPTWRQGNEYWNREAIYGEYPSVAPLKETPKKKENGKKKDVRFSDIVEEVEPISPAPVSLRAFGVGPGLSALSNEPGAPRSPKLQHKPIKNQHQASKVKDLPKSTQADQSLGSHNIPNQLISALDLGTKEMKWGGSWPRSQTSPYNSFDDIDLSRHGPASLLQQNKQFKRNLIKRSRSCYHPRRIDSDGFGVASSQNSETKVRRTVSTTKTTTVQVQIDVHEKEEIKETYL
ncbi:hypothetical protein AC249_AIPGENE20527 [Exaiptasia diaphana]|nr:hypothetical protein AC249_AIPGENE20527 [Exaiptasia diaphana]